MGNSQPKKLILCVCKNDVGILCLDQTEPSKLFCKQHSQCKHIYNQTIYTDCEASQVLRQLKTYIQVYGETVLAKQLYDMYNGRAELKYIDEIKNTLPSDITNLIYDKIIPEDTTEMFINYLIDPNRNINEIKILIDRGAIDSAKKWLRTRRDSYDIEESIVKRLAQTEDVALAKLLDDHDFLALGLGSHIEIIIENNGWKLMEYYMMKTYKEHTDEKSDYSTQSEVLVDLGVAIKAKNYYMTSNMVNFIKEHYLDDMIRFLKVCSPVLDNFDEKNPDTDYELIGDCYMLKDRLLSVIDNAYDNGYKQLGNYLKTLLVKNKISLVGTDFVFKHM